MWALALRNSRMKEEYSTSQTTISSAHPQPKEQLTRSFVVLMRPLPSQAAVKQVDRWIDSHKKDLVDLTCRLVNIDTTVPPGLNYPKISQLLGSELKDLGVTPTVSLIPRSEEHT